MLIFCSQKQTIFGLCSPVLYFQGSESGSGDSVELARCVGPSRAVQEVARAPPDLTSSCNVASAPQGGNAGGDEANAKQQKHARSMSCTTGPNTSVLLGLASANANNGKVNGTDSTKTGARTLNRKFSIPGQSQSGSLTTDLSPVSGTPPSSLDLLPSGVNPGVTGRDLDQLRRDIVDAVRQEVVEEMRRELHKVKRDIIEGETVNYC